MESTLQRIMNNEQFGVAQKSGSISPNALQYGNGLYASQDDAFSQTLSPVSVPVEWTDQGYRHASLEAHIENSIAWQVRVNREERGLTQRDLALVVGTRQSAISKLEDPDGGDMRLSKLVKVAHAFDCALLVRFVSYPEFAAWTADVRPDRLLADSFASDQTKMSYFSNRQSGSVFQNALQE
jgi:transcriptional regulator with XRE-family HTH domain